MLCTAVSPVWADDNLKLAVADPHAFESQPATLGRDAFRKNGIALAVTPMHGGADALQAVLNGTVDVAVGVDTTLVLRAFAKGAPVRVLLPAFTGVSDLYWYAKADSKLAKLSDATEANTVGYSTIGSLTHIIVADFARDLKLRARPVATGSPSATLVDVMSGKVDIGFARTPFGLKEVEDGRIRIIGQGGDVTSLKARTLRVIVVNTEAWQKKQDAFTRFSRAWRDSLEALQTDPAMMKSYAQSVHLTPEPVAKAIATAFPAPALQTDQIAGVDDIVSDAIRRKIVEAPIEKGKLAEFSSIPPRK